jgi:putative flippase GtrA
MSTHPQSRPSFLASFSRSQVSSIAATLIDYGVLFSLTEVFHVWYVISTAAGALAGAIANFLLNRHWSFEATYDSAHQQAGRYALISGISLLLNTGGVWAMTEYFKIHYSISVVSISILVGLFFNFPLQRGYVFR